MAASAVGVSLEEYLGTSYEYDPEWIDGELVERPLPNPQHSKVALLLSGALLRNQERTRLFARPDLRIAVTTSRWRVPDFSVFADREPGDTYPIALPLAVIEILSPDDRYDMLQDKLDEYRNAGIEHIWVVDPRHRRIQMYRDQSLLRVDAIEIPARGLRIDPSEIYG